ncbi:hypothetical protein TKK_0006295 [Trichogramma kaykai]|uniref:RWD domain-containing protein n=1 Tax=Trichogramma kaykai TaxID=54128 RepID=A0ABD2XDS2_9HYME
MEALSAIYGNEFKVEDEACFRIKIFCQNSKQIYVELVGKMVESYPSDSAPRIEISAPYFRQNGVKEKLLKIIQDIYEKNKGECIIYQCIEEIREELYSLTIDNTEKVAEDNRNSSPVQNTQGSDSSSDESVEDHISHGPIITDRKSSFQGHAAVVSSVDEVKHLIDSLKTKRKIGQAKHNITAYRIFNSSTNRYIHDCDDDGENGAGSRLLHLLEIMDVKNGFVMVSRWYGGIHLGPDRFKHINNAARQALDLAGVLPAKK